jgi:hypothetical protein
MKINIRVVDVAETARGLFGDEFMGRDMTIPDYRLEVDTPTGGEVTFHQGATADDVAEYWKREGWDA